MSVFASVILERSLDGRKKEHQLMSPWWNASSRDVYCRMARGC